MTYINPLSTSKRDYNAYGRFNYPESYKEILHITKFENDFLIHEIDIERALNTNDQNLRQKIKGNLRDSTTKLLTYEFINIWPTNLTSMRVAYGNSNVLKCSVQFAYDRYFTDYNYDQVHGVVLDDGRGEEVPVTKQIGELLPSDPQGFKITKQQALYIQNPLYSNLPR